MLGSPGFSRTWKGLLFAGLVAFVVSRGVMPALTAITSDFPEYFTSAKMLRDGQDPVKLYDGAWFREQTRRYGVGPPENPGNFSPYPPPTALLLVPLTGFKPLTALRIVTVLNVLCLACSMFLLRRIFAWRALDSALFILLSGWGLLSGLRFGHPYILISTLCLLGYYLHIRRMPLLAGLCLGVFVPIKYYPLFILAGFAVCRQWRVLLGGGIAMAAVMVVSVGVLGWEVHQVFLRDVLLSHLTGHLNPPDAFPSFAAQSQSFDTLFTRLFIFDPVRNPHPWLAAPLARTIALAGVKGLLVLAAAAALTKITRGKSAGAIGSAGAIAPTVGLLGVLGLLMAPGSGTYAVVLLWLPVALLIDYFLHQGARASAYVILCIYALVGYIPYGRTYPFEGHGGLTVLAYPRLLLLLGMFVVGIYSVAGHRSLGRRTAPLVV
jgi:Glycosyltransferase family 87